MTQGGMGSSATAGLTGEIRSLIWPAPYPSPTPSPRATIQPIPTVRGNLQANTDPSSSYQVTDSLFLSSVNVPERTYTSGFVDSTGALLKDSSGRILTEYFYLHLRSSVKLGGTTTAPGLYQFAIISDDGSAVAVETSKKPDGTSVFTRVIDNDMTTASRFVGADRAINFDANTRLPIDLQYFQGPQAYIAVMLMWRKVPTGSSASLYDPLQGVSGSSAFHSYDTKTGISDPQQKFLDLLARGWKVLEPANYELPQGTRPNPCATPGP